MCNNSRWPGTAAARASCSRRERAKAERSPVEKGMQVLDITYPPKRALSERDRRGSPTSDLARDKVSRQSFKLRQV